MATAYGRNRSRSPGQCDMGASRTRAPRQCHRNDERLPCAGQPYSERGTLWLTAYFFRRKAFSMLFIYSTKALSTLSRFSIVEQLRMTVEWSRLPISWPMREAGILVYFCAKYMDICLVST